VLFLVGQELEAVASHLSRRWVNSSLNRNPASGIDSILSLGNILLAILDKTRLVQSQCDHGHTLTCDQVLQRRMEETSQLNKYTKSYSG